MAECKHKSTERIFDDGVNSVLQCRDCNDVFSRMLDCQSKKYFLLEGNYLYDPDEILYVLAYDISDFSILRMAIHDNTGIPLGSIRYIDRIEVIENLSSAKIYLAKNWFLRLDIIEHFTFARLMNKGL